MEAGTAQTVVVAGTGVGIAAWALGVHFYFRMRALPQRTRRRTPLRGKGVDEAMRALLKIATARGHIIERSDTTVKLGWGRAVVLFRVEPDVGGVGLETRVDFTRLWRAFGTGMKLLVFLLVPAVLAGLALVMWHVVIPSKTPNVRAQAVQIVQMVHVLWPPFLVYGLYVKARNALQAQLDNVPTLIELEDPE